MTSQEVNVNMARRGWKSTFFIDFFLVDFVHFASRLKIINLYVVGWTQESHTCVNDLQHPRLGKPRPGLQILDTRMDSMVPPPLWQLVLLFLS